VNRKQPPFVLESTLPLDQRGDLLHESFLNGHETVEGPLITWPIASSKGATSTPALRGVGLILVTSLHVLVGVWLHRFALPAGNWLVLGVILALVIGLRLVLLVLLVLFVLLRCLALRRSCRPPTALGLGFRLGLALGLALGFSRWGLPLGFGRLIFTIPLVLVVLSFITTFIFCLIAEVSVDLVPT